MGDDGERKRISSKIVIIAAGALNTPGLLMDSKIAEIAGDSPSVLQNRKELWGKHRGSSFWRIRPST